MTLRASSSFPKSSRHCYPFLSDGFHDTSNAFPFLTAAKAQSDFERRDEGANDESRRSAKKREQTTFAYDEQFMRSLNTEENSARRLPALDDAQILLLLQRKREEDEDEDEDEDEEEEVAAVEEEKPPPGTSSFSSLWATEAQFAKDAATLERLMLEQVKEAAAAKRTAEKKRSEDDQRGASPRVSTVKVVRGDDLFSRHAMRSFKRIESRDGNIERAFGGRRFRKLYGRIVAKSEKKKGTTVDVYIDRVQGYTDDDDDDDDDNDNDDNAVVGCVDASSAGLDVNFEDTPAFRNEVRRRIDANDAIEGVRRPFVFVQLDSLVSSFGSECRFECYDARNDFKPLDFEIL